MANESALQRARRIEERRYQALELAIAGHATREIGRRLGISHQTVWRDTKSILQAEAERTTRSLDSQRAMAGLRYEMLLRSYWERRDDPRCAAIILKCFEGLRAVWGLDSPARHEVSGPGGRPIQQQVVTLDIPEDVVVEAMHILAENGLSPNGLPGAGQTDNDGNGSLDLDVAKELRHDNNG